MKINLQNTVQLWNALNELKAMNEALHPALTANIAYLRPEVIKWNELSIPERTAIKDAEIEIPLVEIKKEQLPPHVAPDTREILSIIVEGKLKNKKTELEKLIEAKNGKAKQPIEG